MTTMQLTPCPPSLFLVSRRPSHCRRGAFACLQGMHTAPAERKTGHLAGSQPASQWARAGSPEFTLQPSLLPTWHIGEAIEGKMSQPQRIRKGIYV